MSRSKTKQEPQQSANGKQQEDTALWSLTPEDREKLVMDAWEPSLLRKLLSAQNRLKRRR